MGLERFAEESNEKAACREELNLHGLLGDVCVWRMWQNGIDNQIGVTGNDSLARAMRANTTVTDLRYE